MNPNFLPAGYLLHHRYSIQSTIGQGGFGITYLAYDQKLDKEICIKELFVSGNSTRGSNFTVQSQSIGDFSFEEFVQRFVQEARQLARFQHPNIVRVSDIFQENSTGYMVMEYVKGETLKSKISSEGALGEKEAMSLISQLLDAVEEVHLKGMLHRDIKPDNILITSEGRVVLIDFGSAREFAEGKTTTQTAILTPGYAPIEQYSTRSQRGPYTDIYALGATMYFLLTGEKPIPATDRVAEELLPPHKVNSRVTSQLSSAVMLAMELKSEHRFQQVSEMREALKMLERRKEENEHEVINRKEKLKKKEIEDLERQGFIHADTKKKDDGADSNDPTEGKEIGEDATINTKYLTGDDAGGSKKYGFKFPMNKLLLGLLIGVSVFLITFFGVELCQQKRVDPIKTTLEPAEEQIQKSKPEEKKSEEKKVEYLEKEKKNEPKVFYCIGNGQPIKSDKYQNGTCDCPDGSDELPGTCK
jgi:serine/threonine protein kinase